MSDFRKESDKIVNRLFSLAKKQEKTSAEHGGYGGSGQSGSSVSARGNQISGASNGNTFLGQAADGLSAIANIWDVFGGEGGDD